MARLAVSQEMKMIVALNMHMKMMKSNFFILLLLTIVLAMKRKSARFRRSISYSYQTLSRYNIRSRHCSGFGSNDIEKCIIATKDVFDDWVKSHPAALGLRNKEFPHLDDLMSMWGKDRAIGTGAETPVDAIEEINLCNEESDTFEHEIDEQTKCHEDEEFVEDKIRKSEIETTDSLFCPSNKNLTTRKKKGKSDDVLVDLVEKIDKYVVAFMEANEENKAISAYFKKQTESSDRKMRLYDELMELSDFSQQEIMDVGEYILKDEHKIDNFFALPKAFRRDYVVKQLSKINPYKSSFDF